MGSNVKRARLYGKYGFLISPSFISHAIIFLVGVLTVSSLLLGYGRWPTTFLQDVSLVVAIAMILLTGIMLVIIGLDSKKILVSHIGSFKSKGYPLLHRVLDITDLLKAANYEVDNPHFRLFDATKIRQLEEKTRNLVGHEFIKIGHLDGPWDHPASLSTAQYKNKQIVAGKIEFFYMFKNDLLTLRMLLGN